MTPGQAEHRAEQARKPWHGVVVAIATPFREDLSIDFDRLQEHVRWLAEEGCHGVAPNGSLGEYQTLSDQERSDVVRAVIEAAPEQCAVMPGVGAYGWHQARRWADDAASAGADAVLSLPPNAYRASDDEVVAHYRAVAAAGLPVVTYNNPFDTKVDLTPELLATIAEIDGIVAVKEFSGDVRRLHRIRELAPHLDVLAGADDVLLELVMPGSPGWIAGLPNALPAPSVRLFSLAAEGAYVEALALYRRLHPIFRWDSRPEFIQAIKLTMEMAGRYGGPCRPPRLPLPEDEAAQVRKDAGPALEANGR
jgi:4-hydroxy-tetrahydrodipicolinate synthase